MNVSKILDIGINDDLEFYQKREIRVLNLFALITLVGVLIGVSTTFFIKGEYPKPIVLFTTLFSVAILLFHYRKFYGLNAYIFVVAINFVIFILSEQYHIAVGNFLYYFPVIFCIALIHNPSRSTTRTLVFFIITLLSFAFSLIFRFENLLITSITLADEKTLLVYNASLTLVITMVLVYLVIRLINQQNNEVVVLLEKERQAQSKIANSLKEKETLLAEIQHRVKNNLAVITGLLNLQMEKAPCDVSKGLMIESRNRVMSIAMIHERLYKKDNLSKIDLKLYLSELVNEIVKSFPLRAQIQIIEDMEDVEIELTKAVPAGLIVNEVITNSLKHAFTHDMKQPVITIQMKKIFDCMQISLSDNGIGFADVKNRKETSLGITLIESLADQIDAKVSFRNNNGAYVNFVFAI